MAGIAKRAYKSAEYRSSRVADDVSLLELGDVVLGVVVGSPIITGLRRRIRRPHGAYLCPRIPPCVGIGGYHCVRNVVPDFG